MKNTPKKISFAVFMILLVLLPIITVILPKKGFSETENRYLEEFPEFSLNSVFSRAYMKNLEDYITDHFVGRTSWISAKTKITLLSGKSESNGVYILKDRLVAKHDPVNEAEVEKSIAAINHFAEKNAIPTYVMIVPTATEIYGDELPANAPEYSEKKFIENQVYNKLNEKITPLDVYSAMYLNRSDYIYYRNDHHWTSLGAYNAYAAAIRMLGFSPVPWNRFDIEHVSNNFRSSLYSKCLYDGVPADTIDLYTNSSGPAVTSVEINDGHETKIYQDMYFREYLDHTAKYSVFLGTNQPIVTIKTNSEKGGKLLVFKDSFAHSIAPFLAQHYSEITLVDTRYVNDAYENFLDVEKYNQVLFLYNCATFSTETSIKKLDLKP